MKIQIAEMDCAYVGAIVDCYPRLCFLCSHYQPMWFKDKEVTPKELRDLISRYKYVIRV